MFLYPITLKDEQSFLATAKYYNGTTERLYAVIIEREDLVIYSRSSAEDNWIQVLTLVDAAQEPVLDVTMNFFGESRQVMGSKVNQLFCSPELITAIAREGRVDVYVDTTHYFTLKHVVKNITSVMGWKAITTTLVDQGVVLGLNTATDYLGYSVVKTRQNTYTISQPFNITGLPAGIGRLKAMRTSDYRLCFYGTLGERTYYTLTERALPGGLVPNTNLRISPALSYVQTKVEQHQGHIRDSIQLRTETTFQYNLGVQPTFSVHNVDAFTVILQANTVYPEQELLGFSLLDSEGYAFSVVSAHVVGDIITLNCLDLNNAVGDLTIVYSGTGFSNVAGIETKAFEVTFTPTGLIPVPKEPPVLVKAQMLSSQLVALDFDRPLVGYVLPHKVLSERNLLVGGTHKLNGAPSADFRSYNTLGNNGWAYVGLRTDIFSVTLQSPVLAYQIRYVGRYYSNSTTARITLYNNRIKVYEENLTGLTTTSDVRIDLPEGINFNHIEISNLEEGKGPACPGILYVHGLTSHETITMDLNTADVKRKIQSSYVGAGVQACQSKFTSVLCNRNLAIHTSSVTLGSVADRRHDLVVYANEGLQVTQNLIRLEERQEPI